MDNNLIVHASQEYREKLVSGFKIKSLELVAIEESEWGTLYKWHCNDCGQDYKFNTDESVSLIKNYLECEHCLSLRGVYSDVDKLYVDCTIGNYRIIDISDNDIFAECLFCGSIESYSKDYFSELVEYKNSTGKTMLKNCKKCLGSSDSIIQEEIKTKSLTTTIGSRREEFMTQKGDIIKYVFRQSNNGGNSFDTVYIDATSRKLANYPMHTTPNGTILILLNGKNDTVELASFMFGNKNKKIKILRRNKLILDYRRGNLVLTNQATANAYKPLLGYYFKEGKFYVRVKSVVSEFNTEYDAIKFYRSTEEDRYKELAYNPVFDLSSYKESLEMIYNGMQDTEVHRRLLVYLATNPWICIRYNLEPLLEGYGIKMVEYIINDSGFICDTEGTPLFCTVKDWDVFK